MWVGVRREWSIRSVLFIYLLVKENKIFNMEIFLVTMAKNVVSGYPKFPIPMVKQLHEVLTVLHNKDSHKSRQVENTSEVTLKRWLQQDVESFSLDPRCFLLILLGFCLEKDSSLLSKLFLNLKKIY